MFDQSIEDKFQDIYQLKDYQIGLEKNINQFFSTQRKNAWIRNFRKSEISNPHQNTIISYQQFLKQLIKVAIKILDKNKIFNEDDQKRVDREIEILKLVKHTNVVQLFEIIETDKQYFLITEFANQGELFQYIVSKHRLSEREACRFYQQLISGIDYLHLLNIVHRDLKPENILISENKQIKIIDFGLSNRYQTGQKLKTCCGSPCYAAPEMV